MDVPTQKDGFFDDYARSNQPVWMGYRAVDGQGWDRLVECAIHCQRPAVGVPGMATVVRWENPFGACAARSTRTPAIPVRRPMPRTGRSLAPGMAHGTAGRDRRQPACRFGAGGGRTCGWMNAAIGMLVLSWQSSRRGGVGIGTASWVGRSWMVVRMVCRQAFGAGGSEQIRIGGHKGERQHASG